jgi:hypothetical protein
MIANTLSLFFQSDQDPYFFQSCSGSRIETPYYAGQKSKVGKQGWLNFGRNAAIFRDFADRCHTYTQTEKSISDQRMGKL